MKKKAKDRPAARTTGRSCASRCRSSAAQRRKRSAPLRRSWPRRFRIHQRLGRDDRRGLSARATASRGRHAASDHRRWREALLRGDRQGHPDRLHPRVRRRLSLVGAAGALLRALLSLHHGECARLSALDVPPDGAKYSQARARDDIRAVLDALKIDKAHIVGLSMGGFARCISASPIRRAPLAGDRGCGYGAEPDKRAQFAAEAEASANRFGEPDHREGGRGAMRSGRPGAAPEPRSARLARIRRSVRRALDRGRGADHAWRAGEASLAVRTGRR